MDHDVDIKFVLRFDAVHVLDTCLARHRDETHDVFKENTRPLICTSISGLFRWPLSKGRKYAKI